MLKGNKIIVFLVCISLSLPVLVGAGEVDELKKKLMFDQKKLIVMQNMEFTADEGKFFWPVYEELQKELSCLRPTSGLPNSLSLMLQSTRP
jgi:hypothetical protein